MSFNDLARRQPQRANLDKIAELSLADRTSGGRVEDVLGFLRASAQGRRRINKGARENERALMAVADGEAFDRRHPEAVRDADGGINTDQRTRRDHWDGQGISIEEMHRKVARAALGRLFDW